MSLDARGVAHAVKRRAVEADTNPKRKRGCCSRPRLRFGLVAARGRTETQAQTQNHGTFVTVTRLIGVVSRV